MSRTLNQRITRLEQTLTTHTCICPHGAELSWPGHQPNPTCPTCSGQRLIYPLAHHPRQAEPLLRAALPIFQKAYNNDGHTDLSKLSNQELQQLKRALQAIS